MIRPHPSVPLTAEPTTLPNSAHRTPVQQAPAREPPRARARVPENLVLLTRDRTLFQSVRMVSADHSLATVSSESDLATQLAQGSAGVAIVDAAAATSAITDLTQRLAAQFPDLVLIVAGDSRDQGLLTGQITQGAVHRFLHKPVSEQRVRLFVEAAWRRHEQEQSEPVQAPQPSAAQLPARSGSKKVPWIGISVAVGITAVAAAWFVFFRASGPQVESTTAAATRSPGDDSQTAVAMAADAQSAELQQLIAQAEQALLAGQLEEAERLAG